MPTFGTVCDGIGCGHLAFNQVGFECAWSFEIEPFPSAVLAYRFPEVTNHGDMLKCAGMVKAGEIEAPDVFIGGTPCQAFSVAGKRKGLKDARGNLSLTFCGIVDAIDDVRGRDGKPPCAVLWENVPGVLSDKGNAFGCFLGELSGAGCQLQPAGGRWRNAGCVFGPKRTVAWRVLDSQFFGVAQRRRRVFVVASAGDGFRPEEILFEREGVRRDSAPSREAGKGVTSDVGSGSKVGHWDGGGCHPSLTQSHNTGGIGASNQELFSQRGSGLVPDICGCLSDGAHNGGGLNGQDAYTGRIIPVQTYDMRGNGDGETVGTLTGDHAGRPTDYTPVVCLGKAEEKDIAETRPEVALLSGGDVCRTLSARHDSSLCADRGQEIIAICDVIHGDKSCNGKGWNDDGSAYILDTMATQGMAFVQNTRDEVRLFGGDGQTVGALSAQPGMKQQSYIATSMQVRRLTPRECERLQGLPDDWTKIPWRGKPAAECPDGPRYKGIGNGQTVNVMRWLAERIKKAIAV
jgi:DNA (cytosine-5)-methyltransferase 1